MPIDSQKPMEVDKWIDRLIRLLNLLRPKFYNRITWVIVAAGLAMMSTALWENVLSAILQEVIELNVTSNNVGWGFALVCVALIYHVVVTRLYEYIEVRNSEIKTSQARERVNGVWPLIEQLSLAISEHHRIYIAYCDAMANKGQLPEEYEQRRLQIDEAVVKIIDKLVLSIPVEYAELIGKIRLIISCYFFNTLDFYYAVHQSGLFRPRVPAEAALQIYSDYLQCFQDMSRAFSALILASEEYQECLKRHHIGKDQLTSRKGKQYLAAEMMILLHERWSFGKAVQAVQAYADDD